MGFFMRLQGDNKTGAGHAGLMDMLNDIFAPGKEHSKEQQQYDERVGRRATSISGKPLDFSSNKIELVVDEEPSTEADPTATADKPAKVRSHRKPR